jgi:hypothetical protein
MNKFNEVAQTILGEGFDIEIGCKSRICGDDFQALKRYLDEEGYFEAAREWCGLDIAE